MEWLIVGLGNPEPEYAGTRHNIGREAVDLFRERYDFPEWRRDGHLGAYVATGELDGKSVILLEPDEYMNVSGLAVRKAVERYDVEISRIVVVHDDIDLPLGSVRMAWKRGAGGHNGVISIFNHLHSKDVTRVRIGIAPRLSNDTTFSVKPKGHDKVRSFVLNKFTEAERNVLYNEVLPRTVDIIASIVSDGVERAMHTYHTA